MPHVICEPAQPLRVRVHAQSEEIATVGGMSDSPEPREHPSLAKYPGVPTKQYTRDGVTWRIPARRDRDEAVPVPVEDLVQARGSRR